MSSDTIPHSHSNPLALRLTAALVALALLLGACQSPAPTPTPLPTAVVVVQGTPAPAASSTPAGAAATATAPPAPTDTPAPHFIVGYVAEAGGAPRVLEEIQAMATPLGWDVVSQSDPATGVGALAELGAQVVVANGAGLEAAAHQAAAAFPNTYFIGVDQSAGGDELPNLLVLGPGDGAREDQLGFMAGVTAGYATRAQVVTAVGYPATPAGLKYRNGFLHGVRYACSRCRVDMVDATDLNSDPAAVERARLNASLSSDVVFAAAGATGLEALRAAATQGVWLIGADSDVYTTEFGGSGPEADHVLASVYFDPGGAVTAALSAYQSGTPWTGSRPYSAAVGAVALAPFRVTEDVLSELDRSDIAAALALLASGELETGIDPLTGNER